MMSRFYWSKRWWGGSGINWTICKSFAPRSRQITMPVPHHSVFTGRMPFLPPSQQCQTTEGTLVHSTVQILRKSSHNFFLPILYTNRQTTVKAVRCRRAAVLRTGGRRVLSRRTCERWGIRLAGSRRRRWGRWAAVLWASRRTSPRIRQDRTSGTARSRCRPWYEERSPASDMSYKLNAVGVSREFYFICHYMLIKMEYACPPTSSYSLLARAWIRMIKAGSTRRHGNVLDDEPTFTDAHGQLEILSTMH